MRPAGWLILVTSKANIQPNVTQALDAGHISSLLHQRLDGCLPGLESVQVLDTAACRGICDLALEGELTLRLYLGLSCSLLNQVTLVHNLLLVSDRPAASSRSASAVHKATLVRRSYSACKLSPGTGNW